MVKIKFEIIIDKSLGKDQVKIYTNNYSEEIKAIENFLSKSDSNQNRIIVGFKDDQVFVIDPKNIISIYSQDKNVFIEGPTDTYKSRLRLYELEERLDKKKFIRISRFEIINIDYIKKLDLSFSGTIALNFKNGKVSYVSRRHLKEFKKIFGI